MPGPYKMRGPAFVGAGHAPPAFNDFEIYSIKGGVAVNLESGTPVPSADASTARPLTLQGDSKLPSTINDKIRAGDVSALLGREENHRIGDIFWCAQVAERHLR